MAEEYWAVLYKAVADFGDLMRKAAEAEAALKAIGKAADDSSAAQVRAEKDIIAARSQEIQALKSETSEIKTTTAAWKDYNIQALYGGRQDMGSHLGDMQRELELETLLNRQRWLGFTTPQSAYAWRQNELQQRRLMNYAEWGGYTTPDQYLAYLQREKSAWADLNAIEHQRVGTYGELTTAALGYANALTGTHQSITQIAEGGSVIPGVQAVQAALAGIPQDVTTRVTVDDAQGLAQLAAWQGMLRGIPRTIGTEDVIHAAYESGGVSLGGPASLALDDVQFRQDLATDMALLHNLPTVVDVTADFNDAKAKAEMAAFWAWVAAHRPAGPTVPVMAGGGASGGGGGPPPVAPAPPPGEEPNPNDITAFNALSDAEKNAGASAQESVAKLLAEAAAATTAADAARYAYAAQVAQAAASKAAGTSAEDAVAAFLAQAAAADKAADAARYVYAAQIAAAQGIKAVVEGTASADAQEAAQAQLLAEQAKLLNDSDALYLKTLTTKKAALGSVAASQGLLATVIGQEAKAQKDAAAATDAGGNALAATFPLLATAATGWAGLGAKLSLFAGIFGTGVLGGVAAWHLILDVIIELLAAIIPAIVTLVVGLAAFAAAGTAAAQDVYTRMKDVLTVSTATGQLIPPLTGKFQALQNAVRPMVWQLFGDALILANGKMGLFGQLAEKTGAVVDRLAARFVVFASNAGKGLNTFFNVGGQDLAKFGEFFAILGNALMNLIRVTQTTHIDQFFLDFLIVVAKFIDLISRLPTPVLAAAFALHAIWLYGGLAFTILANLLTPVRALALAMGGLAAAESAGGLASLSKDASGWQRFQAIIKDIGNGLGAIPARFNLFGKAATDAGTAAEGASGAIAGEAAAMEGAGTAAEGAAVGTGGLLATLGGSGGLIGLAVAAAIAIAAVSIKLGFMHDATLTWASSLQTAMKNANIFQVVGVTAQNLAAVTIQLAQAQKLGTGNATELYSAQNQLSQQLGLETTRVGAVSKTYGVDFVGALELLNTAGVKTSDLFTTQNKVWAGAQQQVAGLVAGYKAMGQGTTELQQDVNALLVTQSDQLKQMQSLNQAWDQFTSLVSGPLSSFLSLDQAVITLNQDMAQSGATMTGLGQTLAAQAAGPTLSNAAIAAQTQFQQVFSAAQQVFDAFRSSQAVTGLGDFDSIVKDIVAWLVPLAGNSKTALAEISALAQEAGGPAVSNFGSAAQMAAALTKWTGNIVNPALQAYNAVNQMSIATSNLSQDAAQLTTTLQQDLNPAMAQAIFNAQGGQKPFQNMVTAFNQFGSSSPQFVNAARAVAQELLAVSGNTGNAKANFIGFAEAMGESPAKANALWASLTTGPGALSATSRAADQLRQSMGGAKSAAADLGSPGLWGQIEHNFMEGAKNGALFEVGILNAIPGVTNALGTMNAAIGRFFVTVGKSIGDFFGRTVPMAAGSVASFFSGPFASALITAWNHAWSALASPVSHAFDSVKAAIVNGFDGWWKTHGQSVETVWRVIWSDLPHWVTVAFNAVVNAVSTGWDKVDGLFKSHGGIISSLFKGNWDLLANLARNAWNLQASIAKAGWSAIEAVVKAAWDIVTGIFKAAWTVIMTLWKLNWDVLTAVGKAFWAGTEAFFKTSWDVIVGIFSVALDLLTGHWKTAWTDIQNTGEQILHALENFFSSTWDAIKSSAFSAWDSIKSGITSIWNTIDSAAHSLWNDLRNGFDNVVSAIAGSWNRLEGIFKAPVSFLVNTVYDNGIAKLWNDVMGAIGGPKLPIVNFRQGGRVDGYAPNSDTVNARVSPGEYILTPEASAALGYDNLDAWNKKYSGRTPVRYSGGGTAYPMQFATGGTAGDPLSSIINFFTGIPHDVVSFFTGAIDIGKIVSGLLTGNTTAIANALAGFVQLTGIPASGELLDMMLDLPKSMIGQLVSFIKGYASKTVAGLSGQAAGIGNFSGPGGGAPAANAALARSMYPPWGSGAEWAAWNYVAMRESGWNQFANNPSSGAYGIPQALPYTKMPKAAWPPFAGGSANPAAQIAWMISYIRSVYGDPINAAAHEQADNWYGSGGPVRFAAGGPSTPWKDVKNTADAMNARWGPAWNAWNAWARVGEPKGATQSQWQAWRADTEIGWAAEFDARQKFTTLYNNLIADPTKVGNQWEPVRLAVDLWHGIENGNVLPSNMWGPERNIKYPKGYTAGKITPSAYIGKHYYPGMQSSAYSDLSRLQQAYWTARNAWFKLYGPGGAGLVTPRPGAPPPSGPPLSVNLMPDVTVGGPSVPVLNFGGGSGYGFAHGGTLGDVMAMFSGGLVSDDMDWGPGGFSADQLARAMAKANRALSAANPPRTLGDTAATGLSVGTMTINNPVAEQPSQSITRANNRLAFLAGRGLA